MASQVALAHCKPLSDPVKSFARAVGFGMLLCLLGGANQLLFLLILVSKDRMSLAAGGMMILTWAILLSFVISLPLGMWLLLRTRKRAAVIYLRAFRSDRSARRLRSLLKAALGSQFRLSGIRQPRKRSTLFIRLFTQALTALKYVGSEHFELEAEDHNWMARLLASYAHTRFVFIDVRDVTPHVATEIQLSYLAMGPERCVFVIDPRQTEVQWTRTIRTVVDLTSEQQPAFHLVSYSEDRNADPKALVLMVRQMVDSLPPGTATISAAAIAFAQKHIPENEWPTRFLETDGASTLFSTLGLAIMILAIGKLSSYGIQSALSWVLLSFMVMVYVFYLMGWFRAWKQSGIEWRFRRPAEGNPRWSLILSLILMIIPLTLFGAVVVNKEKQSFHGAQHARIAAEIQNIKSGLAMYMAFNGFYPTTEQGLGALAFRPETEPVPGSWNRFLDEAPKDPWGTQYVYRCPGRRNPDSYDLFSAGPDRIPDTADDEWGK